MTHRTAITLPGLALLTAVWLTVNPPHPLTAQETPRPPDAVGTQQESAASGLAANVVQLVRDRQPDAALDALGDRLDEPIQLNDLLYSDLPSAAASIHRAVTQMSSGQQYDLWEAWTLRDAEKHGVRVFSIPVPTDAPPKAFARSIGERPRDSTFAVASVGPVPGLFCSGWALVRAADDLGRLSRLRVRLEELVQEEVAGAKELLMLAHLAGARGDLALVEDYLTSQSTSVEPATDLSPADVTGTAIAAAALLHAQTQAASESYLRALVDHNVTDQSIGLRPFLRIAHAVAVQTYRGESAPETLFRNRMKYWVPVSIRTAGDLERGKPDAVWLTHEQHVLHLAGGTADLLFCRFPLIGEFDFVCETQEGGAIGTDGGLVYGGLQFQALGRKDELTVWDADARHSITRVSPFARFDTHPVFNRVSIRSTQSGSQFESNLHPVWFDGEAVKASPWIGLRSSGNKRPVFRNLRLTGEPQIPRQVVLIAGDELRGWQSGFFGESQPPFSEGRREEQSEIAAAAHQTYDWQIQSGELRGAVPSDPSSAARSGLLQYQRPLLDGEKVTYEFFHQGDEPDVHPAIGRLAFLLEPNGIRVRWITTGHSDWTGLEPDNAALEPLYRRGPRPLPLRTDSWNTVTIEESAGHIQLRLNDELVYQRPIEGSEANDEFALYRPTRTSEVRVRNAVMQGDWPETVPAEFLDNPAQHSQ